MFAECFRVVGVEFNNFGRISSWAGSIVMTLKSAMGDFGLIPVAEGFDVWEDSTKTERKHSIAIVWFTYCILLVNIFILFMIMMNFIIAVIGDSYSKVINQAIAHDYRQKANLIYEQEIQFTKKDFKNQKYFPDILVVRKKKCNNKTEDTLQGQLKEMKNFMKQSLKSQTLIKNKTRENSEHMSNYMSQIQEMFKDIMKHTMYSQQNQTG
jgi:hypothetical protein